MEPGGPVPKSARRSRYRKYERLRTGTALSKGGGENVSDHQNPISVTGRLKAGGLPPAGQYSSSFSDGTMLTSLRTSTFS